MSSQKPLILYDHPISSYAQKIRIALREKGLTFEAKTLTGNDPDLQAINPRVEVPTLVDGDFSVLDSTIILEYIEDKWPEPRLLPKDPASRARARMIEEFCDTTYEAMNWGWGEIQFFGRAEGELAEKLKGKVKEQTKVIQGWLSERLGESEYFGGSEFGWADVCTAALVNRSRYFGLGPEEGSPLDKWLKRVSERPSVKETFAEFEKAAPNMAKLKDAFLSGKRKRQYRDHRLEWMIKSGGIEVVQNGLEANNIRFNWP